MEKEQRKKTGKKKEPRPCGWPPADMGKNICDLQAMAYTRVMENNPGKFKASDIALYPYLRDHPDECRKFLSSFLPVGQQSSNTSIDDAVATNYVVVVPIRSGTVSPRSTFLYLPRGAIERTKTDTAFGNMLVQMVESRYWYSGTGKEENSLADILMAQTDDRCLACQKNTYYPQRLVSPWISWPDQSDEVMMFTIIATNYLYCNNNRKCACTVLHYIFGLEDQKGAAKHGLFGDENNQTLLFICNGCGIREKQQGQFQECPKCKVTFHCCKECQVSDWPKHKEFCCRMPTCDRCMRMEKPGESYRKCPTCLKAVYCSKKCETKDFKMHKQYCIPRTKKKKEAEIID